jgi:hypothetical protein
VSCCDDACKLINPFKMIIFMSILICIYYQKWFVLCTISNDYLTLVLGVWKIQIKISSSFRFKKLLKNGGFCKGMGKDFIFQCTPFDQFFDFWEPMGEGWELTLWFFENCHMLNGLFLWKKVLDSSHFLSFFQRVVGLVH